MNELNYASLEASKKLMDAGIVLEAEYYWIRVANSPMMLHNNIHGADEYYPAPSMAEVWRELPAKIGADHILEIYKEYGFTKARYWGLDLYGCSKNPTDVLIDLLVRLKGEGKWQSLKNT